MPAPLAWNTKATGPLEWTPTTLHRRSSSHCMSAHPKPDPALLCISEPSGNGPRTSVTLCNLLCGSFSQSRATEMGGQQGEDSGSPGLPLAV